MYHKLKKYEFFFKQFVKLNFKMNHKHATLEMSRSFPALLSQPYIAMEGTKWPF